MGCFSEIHFPDSMRAELRCLQCGGDLPLEWQTKDFAECLETITIDSSKRLSPPPGMPFWIFMPGPLGWKDLRNVYAYTLCTGRLCRHLNHMLFDIDNNRVFGLKIVTREDADAVRR